MTYKFLPEAEIDLLTAVGYYEDCEPSLPLALRWLLKWIEPLLES